MICVVNIEFVVYNRHSKENVKFPVGTKIEWQRLSPDCEDEPCIQIRAENVNNRHTVTCPDFPIEKYVVYVYENSDDTIICNCEDEIVNEAAEKETIEESEIILNYLNGIDKNNVKNFSSWLDSEKEIFRTKVETIKFLNLSDDVIIGKCLLEVSNEYRRKGDFQKADKITEVRHKFLSSEVKE